jgi:small subunit ribosomal protein S14
MAKLSSINKNNRRKKMVKQYAAKWAKLKEIAKDESFSVEERFAARLKLQELPRNSHPTRVRSRCALTGRARGNYRKFGISRLMLRELASQGLIPGVTKSSW